MCVRVKVRVRLLVWFSLGGRPVSPRCRARRGRAGGGAPKRRRRRRRSRQINTACPRAKSWRIKKKCIVAHLAALYRYSLYYPPGNSTAEDTPEKVNKLSNSFRDTMLSPKALIFCTLTCTTTEAATARTECSLEAAERTQKRLTAAAARAPLRAKGPPNAAGWVTPGRARARAWKIGMNGRCTTFVVLQERNVGCSTWRQSHVQNISVDIFFSNVCSRLLIRHRD